MSELVYDKLVDYICQTRKGPRHVTVAMCLNTLGAPCIEKDSANTGHQITVGKLALFVGLGHCRVGKCIQFMCYITLHRCEERCITLCR